MTTCGGTHFLVASPAIIAGSGTAKQLIRIVFCAAVTCVPTDAHAACSEAIPFLTRATIFTSSVHAKHLAWIIFCAIVSGEPTNTFTTCFDSISFDTGTSIEAVWRISDAECVNVLFTECTGESLGASAGKVQTITICAGSSISAAIDATQVQIYLTLFPSMASHAYAYD
jgi:hypothetical protein